MENGPFEDVFPIENGDIFSIANVSLPEGTGTKNLEDSQGPKSQLGNLKVDY